MASIECGGIRHLPHTHTQEKTHMHGSEWAFAHIYIIKSLCSIHLIDILPADALKSHFLSTHDYYYSSKMFVQRFYTPSKEYIDSFSFNCSFYFAYIHFSPVFRFLVPIRFFSAISSLHMTHSPRSERKKKKETKYQHCFVLLPRMSRSH